MKTTKKIASLILTGALAVSSMSIAAYAQEAEDTSTDLEPVVTTEAVTEPEVTEPETTTEENTEDTTTAVTTTTTTTTSSSPKTGQTAYAFAAVPVVLVAGAALARKKK
jgi:LPXTG-motif cell wall-anchored protein